jgi:hypothetical protein
LTWEIKGTPKFFFQIKKNCSKKKQKEMVYEPEFTWQSALVVLVGIIAIIALVMGSLAYQNTLNENPLSQNITSSSPNETVFQGDISAGSVTFQSAGGTLTSDGTFLHFLPAGSTTPQQVATGTNTPINLTGVVLATNGVTTIPNGNITNAMLANAAVANLSGSSGATTVTGTLTTTLGASIGGFLSSGAGLTVTGGNTSVTILGASGHATFSGGTTTTGTATFSGVLTAMSDIDVSGDVDCKGTGNFATLNITSTAQIAGDLTVTTGNVIHANGGISVGGGNFIVSSGVPSTVDSLTANALTVTTTSTLTGNATCNSNLILSNTNSALIDKSTHIGLAILVGGTVTVTGINTGLVPRIFVSRYLHGGSALGNLIVTAITGAGFTVTSYDSTGVMVNTDTSSFVYWVIGTA